MNNSAYMGSIPEQAPGVKERCEKILKRHEYLVTDRSGWESHWQECMINIVPRKSTVTTTQSPGDKRGNELFDSTAINANMLLASALHSMLTNPATRFFELIMGDPTLDDDDQVRKWLQDVAEKMYIAINNSNFQTEVHEIYIDLGAIGTAALFMAEHDENIISFAARPIKEIFIDENNLGRIDTVNRAFKWTPRQIVQEFGADKLPEFIVKKADENCNDEWDIIHHVCANEYEDQKKVFPYSSEYILKDHCFLLSKGGFREFPYAVPRWTKTSGEVYGRGPGMDALPDIKMLQEMMKSTLEGAQKAVNPPLAVQDDGVVGRVRLTPGGLTVVRPGSEPIRPLIPDTRVDFGMQMLDRIKAQVRSAFFVDQLQLNEGPQMTATEVSQRTDEKMRLMGPVLGRQHFEFLRPVIERLFAIMLRRNLLPAPPTKIAGKKFDVRYSSLIARAQRLSEVQNIGRALSIIGPFLQIDPNAADVMNIDKSVKYALELTGVPEKVLRDDREIKQRRDQRAQMQQQAMQQQAEAHAAQTAGAAAPMVEALNKPTPQGQ